MDIDAVIKKLETRIENVYNQTRGSVGENIYRGQSRAISADIEDAIALFVADIRPTCKIFLDSSVRINRKKYRPDMLVVNEENKVIALIEIKANMGWCRNAKGVIDSIVSKNEIFREAKIIKCEFSNCDAYTVFYCENVKLFLLSLTKANCSDDNHKQNKEYAAQNDVYYFSLFDGWYDALTDCQVVNFARCIGQI